MKKLKVVIASVLAGSGHNSAGALLAELLGKDDRFEVVLFTHPTKILDTTYNLTTTYSPLIWNVIVQHPLPIMSDFYMLSSIHLVSQAVEMLRKHNPDIVIATQYTVSQCFKIAEIITAKYPLTLATYLDYGDQPSSMLPYNIFARAEYAAVFEEASRKSYLQISHQDKKHILLSGHTCRAEFRDAKYKYPDKLSARKAVKKLFSDAPYNQFSETKTTILLAGGGGGLIQKTFKLLKIIAAEQKKDIQLLDKYQFVVICGQNHKYFKKLMKVRRTKLSWQNIFPVGWLNAEMYATIQRASDFPVLFGIAPATMHELLETECGPLIVHKLRAVHEMQNVDFMIRNKLGLYQPKIADVVARIFKPQSEHQKQKFIKDSQTLLSEELQRIQALPETLYKIKQDNYIYRPLKVFKVPWYQVVASVFLTAFTIVFYYATLVVIWANKLFNKTKAALAKIRAAFGF